ncbi:MAG: metal ABC transporter permease [Rhabdochlamydiaceae bacterium]|nr:metal ABC transporter permease [Rhabdochlamydiaceae bacterium]
MDFSISALFTNPFLLMALGAGLAASISGGIIGTYVVTKRIVFMSGSISHAVLGGMGLFLWLRRTYSLHFLSPFQGALFFALLAAVLLGWIHLKCKEREDSIIAALWATGTSIGVIFITFTPGYNVELMNFLFGNILWATQGDVTALLILDALVISSTLFFYRKFQAICFDEQQAALQRLPVKRLYIFLLCLIALSVVVLIQVVGAILVISLLTMPAAAASSFTHRLSSLMKLSVGASILFTCLGIYASYELNWPPGATITLIAAVFYSLSLVYSRLHRLRN